MKYKKGDAVNNNFKKYKIVATSNEEENEGEYTGIAIGYDYLIKLIKKDKQYKFFVNAREEELTPVE